jgi:glycosyltransferase involved in cell wall biosynthesis
MRLSVVVPTYNRSDVLARALDSIEKQSYSDLETLVVDDASDEDISVVVRASNIPEARVIRRSHRGGAAAARNTGVAEATGDIIAFLDSDDAWAPEKLQCQVDYFNEHPNISLACTEFLLRRPGRPDEHRRFDHSLFGRRELAFGCGLSPGSTLCVRASFFLEVGPFDERLRRLEDWDWLLRAADRSAIGIIDAPLATIFVGPPPITADVAPAVKLIGERHKSRFRRIGLVYYLRFAAALQYEHAVASYRDRAFAAAICRFLVSHIIYPFRSWRHYARIVRALITKAR